MAAVRRQALHDLALTEWDGINGFALVVEGAIMARWRAEM